MNIYRLLFLSLVFFVPLIISGCASSNTPPQNRALTCNESPCADAAVTNSITAAENPAGQYIYNNSITVNCSNPMQLWEAVVTAVSRYFPIEREYPCRQVGSVVNSGNLVTGRQIGASVLEPWRKDSVGMGQRWESTIQTISRRAVVRVWSTGTNTYAIDVIVNKEIENNPHPDSSRTGAGNYFLSDSRRTFRDPIQIPSESGQWINKGRDPLLEQRLLADITESIRQNCR